MHPLHLHLRSYLFSCALYAPCTETDSLCDDDSWGTNAGPNDPGAAAMHRRTLLKTGLVVVTSALPPGLDPPPFVDLNDPAEVDRADARLDAIRAAIRVDGKRAHQDTLVNHARRLIASLERARANHDLYPRLAWAAFYAAYMAAHGYLDQREWWHARLWMGYATDLASKGRDPEMALLARCGVAATKTFAAQPGLAISDLRRLGWSSEIDSPPSPVSITLDVEAFTAMAAVAPGDVTRRILERALDAASRLGDEPAGRVMERPRVESVAAWGGFALAETPDGTELAEAERLLAWNLTEAHRNRNLMAITETQSALALVLARRGNVGAARVHAVAAHEGAVRMKSRRSAERVRRARTLLPV